MSSVQGATLQARPASCVAVHRGQVCYVRVRISWSLPDESEYCLRVHDDAGPATLACWRGTERSFVDHAYASAEEARYSLVRTSDDATLREARVRTAWVYRTKRRSSSGWRLF